MNLNTPDTLAPQSSSNAMRPLSDEELEAIIGGLRIVVYDPKTGKTVTIDM